jgi:hypothetical protein
MTVPHGPIRAINLLPLKDGVTIEEFERFSSRLDQPTLLAQDVVQGFEAYAVVHRTEGAPAFDVVEVLSVRDWSEWESTRDRMDDLKPVIEGFDRVIDGDGVRTLFCTPIPPQR